MNIPDEIRIGAFDYRITKEEKPIIRNTLMNGIHNGDDLVIQINHTSAPQRQVQVVWHEVMHAILSSGGIELSNEEQVIETMSHGVVQVLRDNPWMGNL